MVTQQWSRAGRVGWYQQKRSLMISKGFPNSWSYNCAMDFKHAASPKWFKSVDTHWAGKVQSFVPLLQNKQGAIVFTKLGQFCSTIWCKLPYIVRTNSVILTIRSDNQNDTELVRLGVKIYYMIWINMVRLIVVTSVLDFRKIEKQTMKMGGKSTNVTHIAKEGPLFMLITHALIWYHYYLFAQSPGNKGFTGRLRKLNFWKFLWQWILILIPSIFHVSPNLTHS